MSSFNRVVLMGNVTRDIDLRYVGAGNTAVCDLGLAVSDRRKTASGEWVEETSFVDVTLWGRTAEVASEYASKGSCVLVEGKLKTESWEKDGQRHYRLKVQGERMVLIGSGGRGGSRDRADNAYSAPASAVKQTHEGMRTGGHVADEIPF